MKYTYALAASLAIIIPASSFGLSYDQKLETSLQGARIEIKSNTDVNVNSNQKSDRSEGTSSDHRATSTKPRGNATSTEAKKVRVPLEIDLKGKVTSEGHRSTVSAFVHSLLNMPDREGGIGIEVREIAKTQNDSATSTVSAMKKVEARAALTNFFLGGDYKNLGVIRSELGTTTKNIVRLKMILDKTTDAEDRAEINAQIKLLEAEKIKINAYVESHENIFSLFGWFRKMFVQ